VSTDLGGPSIADRDRDPAAGRPRSNGWYLLLAIPFFALLYPPLYAHENPHFIGIPFFYWYQIAWLFLTAGITTFVYRKTR
jgi:hypothetical protein